MPTNRSPDVRRSADEAVTRLNGMRSRIMIADADRIAVRDDGSSDHLVKLLTLEMAMVEDHAAMDEQVRTVRRDGTAAQAVAAVALERMTATMIHDSADLHPWLDPEQLRRVVRPMGAVRLP